MSGSWARALGTGILGTALVLGAHVVGISSAEGGSPVEPQVIELTYGELISETSYPLEDDTGTQSAVMDLFKGRLVDQDGNIVGTHRCECMLANGFGWTCTHIYSLRQGPYTGRGTVILRGLFRGFNGESVAITGGTGAYAGARGHAIATVDDGAFVHTLFLIP